jgi:hypothetical protein
MLVYPQIISSRRAAATPSTDYPVIDTANAIGASVVWMADFTRFMKDSAQNEVTLTQGSAIELGTGLLATGNGEANFPGPDLSALDTSNELTIFFAGTPTAVGSWSRYIEIKDSTSRYFQLMRDGSTANLKANWPGGDIVATDGVTLNSPVAIAATFANGTAKLYLNGALHTTDSTGGVNASSNDIIKIGGYGWEGTVTYVILCDRALTDAEVSSLSSNPAQVLNLGGSGGSSGGSGGTPSTDYPMLNTLNSVGADILWLVDPTRYVKDSQQEPAALVDGATIDANGLTIADTADWAEWPGVDISNLISTGQWSISLRVVANAWIGGTPFLYARNSAGTTTLLLEKHGSEDSMHLIWPPNKQFWGWPEDGVCGSLLQPSGSVAHYVWTYDGSTLRTYRDGSFYGSRAVSNSTTTATTINTFRLGRGVTGTIKQAFLCDRVLTASEIASLWSNPDQVITV